VQVQSWRRNQSKKNIKEKKGKWSSNPTPPRREAKVRSEVSDGKENVRGGGRNGVNERIFSTGTSTSARKIHTRELCKDEFKAVPLEIHRIEHLSKKKHDFCKKNKRDSSPAGKKEEKDSAWWNRVVTQEKTKRLGEQDSVPLAARKRRN